MRVRGPSESQIQAEIRQALNLSRRVRLVRNHVGFHPEVGRYGLGVGSPDLIGITLDGSARCFAIEVKAAAGRLRPDQEAWWRAARQFGIVGGVARSVEEALGLMEGIK